MNTETTTQERPALYVGTYAKYNNGSIQGKWLYLDDYEDANAFLAACKELHKDENDPELMFQDFEYLPEGAYGESLSAKELEKIYEFLALDDAEREIVNEYLDATGYNFSDINDFEEVRDKHYCTLDYTHSLDDNNAMGDYVIENGLIEVPEHLKSYIDYEAIGRDWLMDMSVSSNGFVFTS